MAVKKKAPKRKVGKAAKKSSRGKAKKRTRNLPKRHHLDNEPHSLDNKYILNAPGGKPIAECLSPHPVWNDKSAKAPKKSSRAKAKKLTELPKRRHFAGEPHSADNKYILDAPGGTPIAECTSPHGPPKSGRSKR